MDRELMWILATIGSATLVGTFWKLNGGFGPMNLRAVGIVLIATFASLLAISRPDSLVAAMGILGAIAGYLFGTKGGSVGVDATGARVDRSKIVGGDLHESVNNIKQMLGEVRDATAVNVANMQVVAQNIANQGITRSRTEEYSWESEDNAFVARLNAQSALPQSNTLTWVDLCLENTECRSKLRADVELLAAKGWIARTATFDGKPRGIAYRIIYERVIAIA